MVLLGHSLGRLGACGKIGMSNKGCFKKICKNGHEISGDNLIFVDSRRRCKTCWKSYQKKAKLKLRQENPRHEVDLEYQRIYSIPLSRYEEMESQQEKACKICGKKRPEGGKRLHTDHDHACCSGKKSCGGCVRGLLCYGCNLVLGIVKDNPALLQKMIDYLKEYNGQH